MMLIVSDKNLCANGCNKEHKRKYYVQFVSIENDIRHGDTCYFCSELCEKEFRTTKICDYCRCISNVLIEYDDGYYHWSDGKYRKLKLCTRVYKGKTCYENKYMVNCHICDKYFKKTEGKEILRPEEKYDGELEYVGYNNKYSCPDCIDFICENFNTSKNTEIYCRECHKYYNGSEEMGGYNYRSLQDRATDKKDVGCINTFCKECAEKIINQFI